MQARFDLGIPLDSRVVGNAGWLIPRKRFDVFLRVARVIAMVESKALFLIAGDGPERQRLESLARSLGIADKVRWLGWQENLTSFYGSLDLALFNTDWDALGLTPLEALGAGVPIVASVLNGGLTEILDDRYGLVFRSHDIALLAQTSLTVLRDRAKAQHLVCVARRRISEVASVEKYVARVCRLLRIPDDAIWGARTVR
jgi:glycosyltransferase involved in cell wall biosynthesis